MIIYLLNADTIEGWFGIHYDLYDDTPLIEVPTPYGEFSTIKNSYEKCHRNNKCSYAIDSIAAYDRYLVMATDSSYLLIDKQANDTTITEVSSLSELPIDVQHESLRHQNAYRFGIIGTGYGSGIFSVQKNMVRR